MGIDLRLLPFDCDLEELSFSHTILDVDRSPRLWSVIDAIEKKNPRPVPDDFTSFVATMKDGETGYGVTHETPYGEPLRYVFARELLAVIDHPGVATSQKNRAVWLYLGALPPDTKIALFWH